MTFYLTIMLKFNSIEPIHAKAYGVRILNKLMWHVLISIYLEIFPKVIKVTSNEK